MLFQLRDLAGHGRLAGIRLAGDGGERPGLDDADERVQPRNQVHRLVHVAAGISSATATQVHAPPIGVPATDIPLDDIRVGAIPIGRIPVDDLPLADMPVSGNVVVLIVLLGVVSVGTGLAGVAVQAASVGARLVAISVAVVPVDKSVACIPAGRPLLRRAAGARTTVMTVGIRRFSPFASATFNPVARPPVNIMCGMRVSDMPHRRAARAYNSINMPI
ncbi:MAG TPA: hypothetical protein VGC09_14130 [Rhodopila sp.]